jgi:hypothetical protein
MTALNAVTTASSADAGNYLHWGVIQISVTNAIIIAAMVLVFVLALVLPFPRAQHDDEHDRGRS